MPSEEQIEKAEEAVEDEINHVSCGDFRLQKDGYRMIARAALAAAEVKPRVKPLVWVETAPGLWTASPEGHRGYEIRVLQLGKIQIRQTFGPRELFDGTLDAAKAHFQAHHDRRVLAALEA